MKIKPKLSSILKRSLPMITGLKIDLTHMVMIIDSNGINFIVTEDGTIFMYLASQQTLQELYSYDVFMSYLQSTELDIQRDERFLGICSGIIEAFCEGRTVEDGNKLFSIFKVFSDFAKSFTTPNDLQFVTDRISKSSSIIISLIDPNNPSDITLSIDGLRIDFVYKNKYNVLNALVDIERNTHNLRIRFDGVTQVFERDPINVTTEQMGEIISGQHPASLKVRALWEIKSKVYTSFKSMMDDIGIIPPRVRFTKGTKQERVLREALSWCSISRNR